MLRTGGRAVAVVVFGVLVWAVLSLPTDLAGLSEQAHRSLERSGVTNPVTAVLLNYRSYDTLLEVAVLLLAILGVWSLRPMRTSSFVQAAGPLLSWFLRWVLPLLLLTGAYLLWIGAFAPGGAFQGGALIGGAIVLLLLGGRFDADLVRRGTLRTGLVAGLATFILVGAGVMLTGRRFLEYPVSGAGSLILLIEVVAVISIGLTLGALFFGGRPSSDSEPPPRVGS